MPKHARTEDIDVDVGDAPTDINPYFVLDIEPDASQDDIKKAYRKAALKHHPDKAAPDNKDAAHTKFQEVAFAFAVLSDERRRRRYDTTGRTEKTLDLDDDDFDWATFFRDQYEHAITEEKINNFAAEYKGSDEEKRHVLDAYQQVKGNMAALYSHVMLSDMLHDEDRFRTIIDSAIDSGDVDAYPKYVSETLSAREKRLDRARKKKEKEAAEAEDALKEMNDKKANKATKPKPDGDLGDLAALIQQRQKGRADNFFDNLEAKYAPKGKKAKLDPNEPSEEAFAANRAKSGRDTKSTRSKR